MYIEVKYRPEDYVKFNRALNGVRMKKCPFCDGEKEIIGADYSTEECPRCEGTGYTKEKVTEMMSVQGPIQKIEIEFRKNEEIPKIKYIVDRWGMKSFEVYQEEIIEKVDNPEEKGTVVLRPDGTRYWWSDWCDSYN